MKTMKKLLSIFLTAALLLSVFCQAGAFSVSALENEEITINEDEILSDDKTANDDEIAAGDAVYSVIGTNIFYYEDNIYDTSTNMTYDPNAEVYKLRLYAVQPRNDVRIKIVKNHSIKEDFDIQSTYYIFDIVSTCDILITFDPITHTTNVYGKGVVPFNVRKVVLLGFGNDAFNWDYTSEDDLLTEVEKGVWEITYKNVMTSSDPYCQVYFGVNPTENTKPNVSYGFGNPNNEIVSSGVETDASILGSRNIAFKVEKDYSTVNLRLDVRNFDPETKTGAKFTVTVTPPSGDVYSLAVQNQEIFFGSDPSAPKTPKLTYNESAGLYELTVKDVQPQTVSCYLLKNNSQTPGEYGMCSENPLSFDVVSTCDVTIIFNPITEEIDVLGDGVAVETEVDCLSVIAAGNGEGNYLNGANWDPCDTSNAMEEVADGIFELTMTNVEAFDNYNVKFAVNSIDEDNEPAPNPWQHTFGAAQETECPAGQKVNLVYGGSNCIFSVPQNGSTVKFRLNLRNFNFATKKGATLLITVTPPEPEPDVYSVALMDSEDYSSVGVGTLLKPDMTYNESTALYTLTVKDLQPQTAYYFYLLKNYAQIPGKDGWCSDYPIFFYLEGPCDVTFTFEPLTGEINVFGESVSIYYPNLGIFSVIAAGNGEGNYLNGANYDPCDTSNAMEEVADGIFELTMTNVKASNNYSIKFAVNSIDDNYEPAPDPWQHTFGAAQETEYPTGETIDLAYGGSNCIFSVPQNGSTVKFRLNLRNFNFATKKGATLLITVTPPVYGVQVVNTGFYPDPDEVLMTYNEETGLYELTAKNVEPQTVEFYVVKDHVTLYGDYYSDTNHPYKFKVDYTCDVTITFDPETEAVTVQSDGIFPPPYINFSVYSVIAAGNGEGNYLNGSNWDPYDTANALEEIEEGVWQLTMKNIDAFDNYQIKFVVNTVDEDGNPIVNPWEHNFGTAQERQYPADEEIDAVYNGSTCMFTVPDDHSTVTFTLDLRNFDIETKQGAKLMINVEPPEPELKPQLGDVNGDGVVDVLDAALIQKFAAEKAQLNEEQTKLGDFNVDGYCDVLDATAIQKSLVY